MWDANFCMCAYKHNVVGKEALILSHRVFIFYRYLISFFNISINVTLVTHLTIGVPPSKNYISALYQTLCGNFHNQNKSNNVPTGAGALQLDTVDHTSLWFDDHGIKQSFSSNNGSKRRIKGREFPLKDRLQSCSILSESLLLNYLGKGGRGRVSDGKWEEQGMGEMEKGLLLRCIFTQSSPIARGTYLLARQVTLNNSHSLRTS